MKTSADVGRGDGPEDHIEDLLEELKVLSARLRPEHLTDLYNRQSEIYRDLKAMGVSRGRIAEIAGVSEKAVDYLATRPAPKGRPGRPAPRARRGECRRCGLVTGLVTADECADCVYETGWDERATS